MTTTPTLWKSLTQVNTTDNSKIQADGQVVALNDGGYVVVWGDNSDTYNLFGPAIVAQRYGSTGNKIGGEVHLSNGFPGAASSAAVTVLLNGNLAVAFVGNLFDLGFKDCFVRIFSPSLALIRTDTIDDGPTQAGDPSITALANGGYAVTFTGDDTQIIGNVVSPVGVLGPGFGLGSSTRSELATLSNGNFVMVHESSSSVNLEVFTPNADPVVILPGVDSGSGIEPDVAALRGGGFVVVWTDPLSTSGDIRATVFANDTGVPDPDAFQFRVNTSTAGTQNEASVVALADGGFLVTWENDNADLVRAQRFDAIGNKIGVEFTVKVGNSVDSPEAAVLTDGRIAFAVGDVSTGDPDVMTSIWDPREPVMNFDGVNQSDFLWQHDNGQAAVWLLHDMSVAFNGAVGPNLGPSWHLIDDGDFNADGRSEFLWQNDNAQAAVWSLNNGTNLAFGSAVGPNPGPSWHVIGTGDFNGDNKSDILWQGDDGTPAIWLMNGAQPTLIGAAGSFNPGPSWHVKGTGDFNGDGKSDILWQSDDGTPAIWLMNGTQSTSVGAVGPFNPGPSWHIKDTGDFNGDNKSDILWQNDNGQAAIWLMNGTTVTSFGAAGSNPGASWHVVGAGQFNNADTNADILWQHDNGQAAVWLMDGMDMIGNTAVGGNPGADWHLIA
jgi:FG-GAP-like repeat